MNPRDDDKDEHMMAWLLSHYGATQAASRSTDRIDGNDVAAFVHGRLPPARAGLVERAIQRDPELAAAVTEEQRLLFASRRARGLRVAAAAAAVLVVAVIAVDFLKPVVSWTESVRGALHTGDTALLAELVRSEEAPAHGQLLALASITLGDDVGGHSFSSPALGRQVMRADSAADKPEFLLPRDFVTTAATHFLVRAAPRGARILVHTLGTPSVELMNVLLPESGTALVAMPTAPLDGGRLSAELFDADGRSIALTTWVVDKRKEAHLEETLNGSARLLAEGATRRLVTANAYLHHGFAAEAALLLDGVEELSQDARAQRTLERARELAGLQP